MKPYYTPVLFIVFNRPDTTELVFEQIRRIKPAHLYIAADGARENRLDDRVKCKDVREIVSKVDWPCEVKTLYREKNMGCKMAVSSAISWFFENVESGIILEDDCLPDQTFFPFCSELLEKYKDETKVGMISGDNFQRGHIRGRSSYYFSYFSHIWGWASWRRAWKLYDMEMSDWPKLKDENWLSQKYNYGITAKYISKSYDDVYTKVNDTWDYQWHYTLLKNNMLTIIPNTNLIKNIGVGVDATHGTAKKTLNTYLHTSPIAFPLKHPKNILHDAAADRYYEYNNIVVPYRKSVLYKSLKKLGLVK